LTTIDEREIELTRPLYTKQKRAIFAPERYSIIEASTKSGKTHGCIAWLLEEAITIGSEGRTFWWVAPTYNQSKIAFTRLVRSLPQDLIQKINNYEMSVVLDNGAKIRHLSAEKPDGLYGEDCYGAVLDEVTRMREEAWYAVRSTLTATRSRARLIGNVKGKKNWAYKLARRAEAGEHDWHYARLTAVDAIDGGVLSSDEIADAKRTLPPEVYRELYEAEPSDDVGNPFGLEAIMACKGEISTKPSVCFGVDLAKSVDWTVIIGLDDDGAVSYFERFQLDWDGTERRVISAIGDEAALVDSTGVGDPIFERLQKQNPLIEGFKFTQGSKQQIMEGIAVAIQNREVVIPDNVLLQELLDFEYEYTRTGTKYSAPVGLHDDAVCAFALAVHKKRNNPSFGVW
tara:strand:- start:528 stop:1727 length:1200 start_codon:yes stop_codon:yes gene_type:complete